MVLKLVRLKSLTTTLVTGNNPYNESNYINITLNAVNPIWQTQIYLRLTNWVNA
jgi:hypothetical protein